MADKGLLIVKHRDDAAEHQAHDVADADEIKLSFRFLAVEDGLHIGIVQQRAGRRLEQRRAGECAPAFGHVDLSLPPAGFLQFGIASDVGLQLARNLLLAAPSAPILRQARDDGRGGFGADGRDRLQERDLGVALRGGEGGWDRRQQTLLEVAEVCDQAQLGLLATAGAHRTGLRRSAVVATPCASARLAGPHSPATTLVSCQPSSFTKFF